MSKTVDLAAPVTPYRTYDASTRSDRRDALKTRVDELEKQRWTLEMDRVALEKQIQVLKGEIEPETGEKLVVDEGWLEEAEHQYRRARITILTIDHALAELRDIEVP